MNAMSGNQIVDKLIGIEFTGNIVPASWYKTITKANGKPDMKAIALLSDIVYWYRPKEIRDENGVDTRYEKKFSSDLLQRNYKQIEERFGFTKREARDALALLENLGVVKRIFRDMDVGSTKLSNVMYLELVPDILLKLTYPAEVCEHICNKVITNSEQGGNKNVTTLVTNSLPPDNENVTTNTEITTKNTTEIINKDYHIISHEEAEVEFKDQIAYDGLLLDYPDEEELLNGMVNTAVDILSSRCKTVRIKRDDIPIERVRDKYRQLNVMHIQYLFESISNCKTEVVDVPAMLRTAMYNAPDTIDTYYTAKANSDIYNNKFSN